MELYQKNHKLSKELSQERKECEIQRKMDDERHARKLGGEGWSKPWPEQEVSAAERE